MPHTIENALEDQDITLENRNDEFGIYEFRVGLLSPLVSVQVTRLPNSEEALFTRSHNIKTPTQGSPYRSSRTTWDDVPYALHQAINGLTSYYRQAVKAGHQPDDAWLVPS